MIDLPSLPYLRLDSECMNIRMDWEEGQWISMSRDSSASVGEISGLRLVERGVAREHKTLSSPEPFHNGSGDLLS